MIAVLNRVCSALLALAFGLFLSLAAVSPALAAAPVSVSLIPQRVSEHVWMVQGLSGMVSLENQGFNSNAAFVVTSEGVVVFDVLGTPALGRELRRQIRLITDKPIIRIVISHYHSDHFYGLQAFEEDHPQIIAQKEVADYLKTDAPAARLEERRHSLAPWVDADSRVVVPTHYVDAAEDFVLGGVSFRIRHAGPGHTPEDLSVLIPGDGVLLAGDLVVAGRIPFVGDADSERWLAAIGRMQADAPRIIVPGHGPVSRDAMGDLDLTRRYLSFLQSAMSDAVADLKTFDEAYEQTDWSDFEQLPAFAAANRTNAYNVFLRMEQRALNPGQE